MTLQSSQRLPELLFYTKKSHRILQAPILHVHITLQSREFSIQNPILHAEDKELFEYYYYIQRAKDLHSRKENSFYAQKARRSSRNASVCLTKPSSRSRHSSHSRHSRDIPDIPVVPDTPETFQAFQSFMTFQPFQAILQCSSISRESTPFQHSPIRMHILHILHILQFLQFDWFPQKTPPSTSWAITNITNIHSSKKGRCCDISQIDIFSRIELFPLSSCQVIILIARMTFNCFSSCLMS